MPQERPQLVSKLRNRELYNAPPGASVSLMGISGPRLIY